MNNFLLAVICECDSDLDEYRPRTI